VAQAKVLKLGAFSRGIVMISLDVHQHMALVLYIGAFSGIPISLAA
jgi:hypothetical protein